MNNYPFKNLVFRGGGILGITYLGALKVLDEKGVLPNIERISGASAGAITALTVSLCSSADEIIELANDLDFKKVPDKGDSKHENKKLGLIPEDVACVKRLLKDYGWYSSNYFYEWLKVKIEEKFDKPGIYGNLKGKNGLQTFDDFKNAGFRDLYVSVTNVSKQRNEILSIESTPDMPVADAIRKSMSIPLYFEAMHEGNDLYADGGLVNNFPISIFDDKKYVTNPELFRNGINYETLGCHIHTSEASLTGRFKKRKNSSTSLIRYIEEIFLTFLQAQVILTENTPNIMERSINIDDKGFTPIDFNIETNFEDPMKEEKPVAPYDILFQSGYYATEKYLDTYSQK